MNSDKSNYEIENGKLKGGITDAKPIPILGHYCLLNIFL